jgi:hypothetical protein
VPDRLLRVNAYTCFSVLPGEYEGHGVEESAPAVLNVTAPREDPDEVLVELELDGTRIGSVPAHADRVRLTAEEARALAAELERQAGRVEDAGKE